MSALLRFSPESRYSSQGSACLHCRNWHIIGCPGPLLERLAGFSELYTLDSRRRTVFTDGGSLQLIALRNPTKGVRPHLKTNALPVDQTVLSPCDVRPLGNAGETGSALSSINPIDSI